MSASRENKSRWVIRVGAAISFAILAGCGAEQSGQPLDDLSAQAIFERGERQIEQGTAPSASRRSK
ncbi:MAG: outer membrane protein assembly factor BamD, partial [Paracoccaceae bacterium]|nr:outer membrane protein assembly factor BamD [Paracoccaceae bacterium]